MFTRIAPQRVQHETGYIVQFGSRETVEHVNGDRVAVFVIDMGSPGHPLTLYTRRATWKDGGAPTETERAQLAEQVRQGLTKLIDRPVEITDE